MDSKSSCPVCTKEFQMDQIESHVDKCLFLNSQQEVSSIKRSGDFSGSPSKKSKFDRPQPSTSSEKHEKVRQKPSPKAPLAEIVRPENFDDYYGQEHVLGRRKLLRELIESNNIPSMVLWGPPGCGKTTLANIIHHMTSSSPELRYVKLSATMSGVNDVKDVIKIAKNEKASLKRQTILFMDEIHRFNKLQQDIFLPHVESGTIILIGATTENPSFYLNSALLSRCKVIVLEKIKTDDMIVLLERAAQLVGIRIIDRKDFHKNFLTNANHTMDKEVLEWLAEVCDGDARIGLNSLQMAMDSSAINRTNGTQPLTITLEHIKDGIKRSHLLYDRKGEEHYNIISALHKSIRASDDNAALYWLARMLEGGEDPLYIARRLVRAASEDVGLMDPMALTLAVSAMQGCQLLGMPECDVILAQAVVYLARTQKSREIDDAYARAKRAVQNHKGALPSVPLHLRNAPTRLMKDLGYGRGYNMRDKDSSNLNYLPIGMETMNFFKEQ